MEDPTYRSDGAHPKTRCATKKRRRLRKQASGDCAAVAEAVEIKKNKIPPVIIHAVNPLLYRADPSDFMKIVQILTGCSATRLRYKDAAALEVMLNMDAQSPISLRGTVESLRPVSSPCSSFSSATASSPAITNHATNMEVLDANADSSDSVGGAIAEDEVSWSEPSPKISVQSPSSSSSGLLLDTSQSFFSSDFGVSQNVQPEQRRRFADSAESLNPANYPQPAPHNCAHDLEPTLVEIYFSDWLSPSDQNDYWSKYSISGDYTLRLH